MRRYVTARHSAAGVTSVTVTLVDGQLTARWAVKTYIGSVRDATVSAERYARRALEELRLGLDAGQQWDEEKTG